MLIHSSTDSRIIAHPHIHTRTQAKGDEIRDLKAQKAEKDAIMPLVGQLNVRA